MARRAGVVVGGEVAKVNLEADRGALARRNAARAREGREATRGLGKLPVWGFEVGLHDRIAVALASVLCRDLDAGAGGVGTELPET